MSLGLGKRDLVELDYIRHFCPQYFDKLCFTPSLGASGCMEIIWRGDRFKGVISYKMGTFNVLG
jgi:hypothetical protein